MSCKQQQERIEETVLQPIDTWVNRLEQRCNEQPCVWWMLCLNKLVCWLVAVLAKVTQWVLTIIVRWVYRVVCTVVSFAIGLVAALTGNINVLVEAFKDAWELIKDAFYGAIGAIIFVALRIVDIVQSAFGLQPSKRRLTEKERAILAPIFRESINYDLIEIVEGSAGILGVSGRPFTMGFTIYIPTYSESTLVHEVVHVWQFTAFGFRYIGNSALNQLDSMTFNPGYDPYVWQTRIDAGDSWYELKSAEAQASFIEDVFTTGRFVHNDPAMSDDTADGAFFREDDSLGQNAFTIADVDYTDQANDAWRLVRTG